MASSAATAGRRRTSTRRTPATSSSSSTRKRSTNTRTRARSSARTAMPSLVQPDEGELKLNGLRIHYFEWKGRGSRPLVLMHGLRDYAYFWQDCANRPLDDFHVYAFDQGGHGESEQAPGG